MNYLWLSVSLYITLHLDIRQKIMALATGTAAVDQKKNSRDTAVLLPILSLLPYQNTAMLYPNNHWLFIRQNTYAFSKDVCLFPRYAKPNPNPNLTLTQTFLRVLHRQSHKLGWPPLF